MYVDIIFNILVLRACFKHGNADEMIAPQTWNHAQRRPNYNALEQSDSSKNKLCQLYLWYVQ